MPRGAAPVYAAQTLGGDFGSAEPPRLLRFAATSSAPKGVHASYVAGDTLRLTFDRPTDFSEGRGNRKYIDSLVTFSHSLGDDYSGAWSDDSTLALSILTPSTAPPQFGITFANVTGDIRNMAGEPSGKLEPAFLSGDFGSADPPMPVAFEASDPDNADATFSALDTLTVRFDMPTDRGRYAGGRAFVDNLLQFSDQLGVDYTGQWADASTLTVTALATHPNFVGFTEAGGEAEALAAPSSRCR